MENNSFALRKERVLSLAQDKANDKEASYGITYKQVEQHLDTTYQMARQIIRRLLADESLIKVPWNSPSGEALFTIPDSETLQSKLELLAAGSKVLIFHDGEVVSTTKFIKGIKKNLSLVYTSQALEDLEEGESPAYSLMIKQVMSLLGYSIYKDEEGTIQIEEEELSESERTRTISKLELTMHGYRQIASMIEAALKNPDVQKGIQ